MNDHSLNCYTRERRWRQEGRGPAARGNETRNVKLRARIHLPSSRTGQGLYPSSISVLAAPSQPVEPTMGTPQEDESAFAILVAGETPGNLHQDKLGEYIR